MNADRGVTFVRIEMAEFDPVKELFRAPMMQIVNVSLISTIVSMADGGALVAIGDLRYGVDKTGLDSIMKAVESMGLL